jgi:hypothetical protein
MSGSLQRYLLFGLASVWCVLILTRFLTAETPEEVPLTFVSGKPAAKTRATVGTFDPWQVKHVTMQAREMPEGPKKNIFAPLGESTVVGATTILTARAKRVVAPPVLQPPPTEMVVAVVPAAPLGPTPEELAEQAARQQEELNLKQVREQMGQYRYLGYLNQQGVHKAFVGKGKDIYILRKGDTLDGKFLVASIDPMTVKLKEPTTSLETSLDLTKEGNPGTS